jgi:hypothetical protein
MGQLCLPHLEISFHHPYFAQRGQVKKNKKSSSKVAHNRQQRRSRKFYYQLNGEEWQMMIEGF